MFPTCLLLVLLLGTAPLEAQLRSVVSSRISVSGQDAALELDFASGEPLEVAFRDGQVSVDGESVGRYERGGSLEGSWRSLLAEAVQLDDGPLARALVAWTPPGDLDGDAADLGRRIDEALEGRLQAAEVAGDPDGGLESGADPARSGFGEDLTGLLRRTERLEALAEALEGMSLGDVRIHVDENVDVAAGEEIEATVIVVDGELDVSGTVDGSVVVTGGALRVYEGGRITGEVRLADARIFRNGGEIDGPVTNVVVDAERTAEALEELENLEDLEDLEGILGADLEELEDLEDQIRARVRDELRGELRDELRDELRGRYGSSGIFAPLRSVGRGLAGLLQNLITFALAVILAGVVVHFFPENMERVAEAARRSPARAGVVGVAGTFLLIPVWVLGMVALAISIIGIPALLAWIPLFPLAAMLAAAFGYLAVARLLGSWVAEQGLQGLDFLRPSNTLHAVAAGLALLLVPYAAANVVEMAGPWLGFIEGLFLTVGWLAGTAAVAVGFGAVLLTRGGRERDPGTHGGGWDDLRWPTDPGPSSGPGPEADPARRHAGRPTDGGDDEGIWEEEWEELEREARERADDRHGGGGTEAGYGDPEEGESSDPESAGDDADENTPGAPGDDPDEETPRG